MGRHAQKAAQHEGRAPFRRLDIVKLEAGKAAQQGRDGDLAFEPRQLRAETEMDAAAEGQRLDLLACNVEPVGLGVDFGVAIARTQEAQNGFALRDRDIADRNALERGTAGELHRGIVAQQFLDGVGGQLRPFAQQPQLVGIAIERQQAVADEIDGGFMAGAEQQIDVGDQFVLGEFLAFLLGLHQLRGQVVARLCAAQREQMAEIVERGETALVRLVEFLSRHRHRIEQPPAIGVARLFEEIVAVGIGNAEHFADHRDRQPEGEILDHVHRAVGLDAVDRSVDDRLDARPHVGDAARGEGLDHEAAQAGVIGRVLAQHPQAHMAQHRLLHRVVAVTRADAAGVILPELLVAQDDGDVGMAAGEAITERRAPQRIEPAQHSVIGIGVADEFRRQRIESGRRRGRHGVGHGSSALECSAGARWRKWSNIRQQKSRHRRTSSGDLRPFDRPAGRLPEMAGSSPAMTMLGISWCPGVLVVKIRGYPAKPGHDGTLPIGLISSEEDKAMSATNGGHNVGGVIYPQPFKIRRLGHFGFNVGNLDASVDFYTRLFGFRLTDEIDIGAFEFMREAAKKMKETRIFFLTYGTDHHAFLLADKTMGAFLGDSGPDGDVTLNQITWQVGTLEEVVKADDYLRSRNIEMRRTGRDMPGSNWHCYFRDPDGHTIELYYGMEQIGWDGRAKPRAMYDRRFDEKPALPQISEQQEVADAVARGVDIFSGQRVADKGEAKY